ncbi:hypothetical protein [Agromyces aerolatus]|uniref:hypothetical protein n=1 Tax=Agromyces sp. LY-1074 TaxID=3074080 RepID=UPI00285AF3A6|nr:MULTISPECIES: hypothetical protein [unclassified Agromyces]MDR5699858.1 hypothetical protein [Agromyces sp. LY-1074]MDR5706330.1 hypothetical protein [Agromyces sp. LY-1358]
MTDIPAAGRQSAHVILDAVSAWDPDIGPTDENADAMNRALERLDRIDGAIVVTADDDADDITHLTLDVSNLTGGAIVLVNWLVHQLGDARNEDPQIVIAQAREFLDE